MTIEQSQLKSKDAYQRHMNTQKKHYGDNYIVNLIDKKGSQDRIGKHFTELVRAANDSSVKYTWFDFHHECKNMKWHNLSKLINELLESI